MRSILYLSAALLIIIPILIVLMSGVPFSSTFSNIVISTAFLLVILGMFITIIQKKKENKSFAGEIGAIVGLFIVIIIKISSEFTQM